MMTVTTTAIKWRTFFTGMLMGAADLVPGISGGTVALLSGIYGRLLTAIGHLSHWHLLNLLRQRQLAMAWQYVDGGFLFSLGLGMATALLLFSKLITWLLLVQPLIMWSLFLGLIMVASLMLLHALYLQSKLNWRWIVPGFLVSLVLASMPVLQVVDGFSGWGYLWLMAAGALAITAMILPGVSGSFILLMLGIYPFLIARLAALDIQVIAVFAVGCGLGLVAFSRVIVYLLKQHSTAVMNVLTGLMMGSVMKLWPWKLTVSYRLNSAGLEVPLQQENLMPWAYSQMTGIDNQLIWCLTIACLAGLLVAKFGRIQLQDMAA
jgi:putative membrane protein